MDKHTPGPTYNLTTIYVQGNDQEIFEVYADESCEQTLGFVYDEQRAQLLAAAPELLAAAKAALADLEGMTPIAYPDGNEVEERTVAELRAAIAKATRSEST